MSDRVVGGELSVLGGRPRLAVVFGGPSAEHDVSIVSGTAIAEALAGAGFAVARHLVDLGGRWWRLPDDHRRADRPASAYDEPVALGATGPLPAGAAVDALAGEVPAPVVFIALHGPFGEDGTIQAILEAAGLAYTGAGVAASAIGMDKALFKQVARGAGLPVLDWQEVRADRWADDPPGVLAGLDAFAAAVGAQRLIVKPARLGSSVGMTIAHEAAERAGAVELALRFDARAVVEPCLAHPRELEVAVLGNDPAALAVFGPGEVFPGHEFYDYADKYLEHGARTTPIAELPGPLAAEARRIAAEAYRLIGAAGFARVDFLLDRTGGRLYLNEINTIPGFTPISLFPKMVEAAGIGFAELCARIVALGRAAHAARPDRRLAPGDLPR